MFDVGSTLILKKVHPCGDNRWEVLKSGVDMRIKCFTCERVLLVPRHKIEKQVKEVVDKPKH